MFRNAERENNFEAEKFGRKKSIIWNHKYSKPIHVGTNHTNFNQTIPDD